MSALANIRGNIDYIEGTEVVGWVLDESNTDRKLHVISYLDDEPFETGIANLHREDVLRSGFKTALCGFRLNFASALLLRPKAETLMVRAEIEETGELVLVGSLDLMEHSAGTATPPSSANRTANDVAIEARGVSPAPFDEALIEAEPIIGDLNGTGKSASQTSRSDAVEPADEVLRAATSAEENLGRAENRITDADLGDVTLIHRVSIDSQDGYSGEVLGYVDGFTNDTVVGWAAFRDDPHTPAMISIKLNNCVVASGPAVIQRPDVAASGLAGLYCGFSFDLRQIIQQRQLGAYLSIEVFIAGTGLTRIGTVVVSPLYGLLPVPEKAAALKRAFLIIANRVLTDAEAARSERDKEMPFFPDQNAEASLAKRPLGVKYSGLVNISTIPSTVKSVAGSNIQLSGYADHVRYRYKVDLEFKIGLDHQEYKRYMQWYIETYAKLRAWRRAPIPASELNYLIGPGSISPANRAMCFFLPSRRKSSDPIGPDERLSIAYWWAAELAPSLFVEDCLVPNWCFESLRAVSERWRDQLFPLSAFMELYFSRAVELHFLDMETSSGRALLYIYFIINASRRPDLLRFMPQKELKYLISTDRDAPIEIILGHLGLRASMFTVKRIENMCASLMFDLKRVAFSTISMDGHRVATVAMPEPQDNELVDVQVIGPFRKASGLGQACRLSASMIKRAGYAVSAFDFGLDNPAPEGFSSTFQEGALKKSRVNVIHLNGESAPMAFAYLPPIMSDSYNIGYFYWELDSPAACHFLSLEILDEIWVSSEYCREIYARFTSKPVINVGMCAEPTETVSRDEARSFLNAQYGYADGDFVFLAAFDSFSFVQRKNPVAVVRAFRAAFPDDPCKRLMLKTHNRHRVSDPRQAKIWQAVEEEAAADARISIVNETLQYSDLRKLKTGVDCYVSLHRSEGWGFGLIESMASGTPIVTTGYSGNMDFCSPDTTWLVDYDEVYLGQDDYIFVLPGQKWAEPRFDSVVEQMRAVASQPDERGLRARAAADVIRTSFSQEAVAKRYGSRLQTLLTRASG